MPLGRGLFDGMDVSTYFAAVCLSESTTEGLDLAATASTMTARLTWTWTISDGTNSCHGLLNHSVRVHRPRLSCERKRNPSSARETDWQLTPQQTQTGLVEAEQWAIPHMTWLTFT